MKPIVRFLITGTCLVLTAASLYNTNSDNSELVGVAEAQACGGKCIKLVQLERSPFSQAFTFQTSIELATTSRVECARSLVFFGDYACKRVR